MLGNERENKKLMGFERKGNGERVNKKGVEGLYHGRGQF